MRTVKNIEAFLERSSRKVLLALFLAAALLLCHGLFGASHQVFSALYAEHSAHGHSSYALTPHTDSHGAVLGEQASVQHQGDYGEGHLGHVAYAAALLVVSLGAVLWLLGTGRTWTRSDDPSSLTKRIVSPKFPSLSPRPNLVLLQVFRL
jgi:hypothetical protein